MFVDILHHLSCIHLYIWSSSWPTSSPWLVCVFSHWRVSFYCLLRLCPPVPVSYPLPVTDSLFLLSYASLPLLQSNWPCSFNCPLVDLLYICRDKHSYFRTPLWTCVCTHIRVCTPMANLYALLHPHAETANIYTKCVEKNTEMEAVFTKTKIDND